MTRRARARAQAAARTDSSARTSGRRRVDTNTRLRYRLIHDQLKSAIALGPGLRQDPGAGGKTGARIFGTSRVPVRKAFEMLHADGLLHTFEGRGYLVASADGSAPEPLRAPLSEAALGFEQARAPLELPSNSERIYHALEAAVSIAITFGHYRIDESVAAKAFGVSRSAVREALSRLRDFGLVEKSAYSHWLAGPLTARAVARITNCGCCSSRPRFARVMRSCRARCA